MGSDTTVNETPTGFDRRAMLGLAALVGVGAATAACAPTADGPRADHSRDMMAVPPGAPTVAMLIHPGMVSLDLVGPMTVFQLMQWNVQLVWKDANPVATDLVPLTATQSFDECPADVDVLFVPGGVMGTIDIMNDRTVLAFLADRGARATWVTSVCTGSLVLAAAGLLKGYDATSHWTTVDLLPLMGARHVDRRVVVDRNRITGGGITAGIDFGLTLAAHIENEEAARKVQLIMEYAPAPPFQNGTPAQAGATRVANLGPEKAWMDQQARLAAETAAKRLRP
jgi:putative intracellular protease/amidase